MKRALARLILLGVIAFPVAVVALLWLALEDQPALLREAELGEADIARAKRIVEANDPRRVPDGVLRTLALDGRDVDLALDYLLAQHASGHARVVLQAGSATVRMNVRVPENPFGRHLNVELVLRETAGLPSVDTLRLGRLAVPGTLADRLVRALLSRFDAREDGRTARDALRRIVFARDALRVEYEWRADLPERLRALFVSDADRARLRAYQERLAEEVARGAQGVPVSLAKLLGPLAGLAADRAGSGDAAAEARAALLVLAFYVNGKGLAALLPEAREWPRPTPRTVVLDRRDDLAAHFAISAALAAAGGGALADAVGVYKEVEDARTGSGFSFTDITADRAGSLLGERLAGPGGAAMARRIAAGVRESDILPSIADLPEFMPEAEFRRRFGGRDDPRYRAQMADIEARLAGLALFR